jgi:hypothetical protein
MPVTANNNVIVARIRNVLRMIHLLGAWKERSVRGCA